MSYNTSSSLPPLYVSRWLFTCAFMVLVMAVIGAITRLTESGLSIAEWNVVMGTLPPLNDGEWQRIFALYQQTPEYLHKNMGMDLAAFKGIFWWEWIHRLWGRLIGLVFALPLFFFLVTRKINFAQFATLFCIFLLGALQGFIGWMMVASGLVDQPYVSPLKLSLHLGTATLLWALLIYMGLKYGERRLPSDQGQTAQGVRRSIKALLGLLFFTLFWGAMVAGYDAGLIYNDYPLMGGQFLPAEAFQYQPWWRNFIENHALIQFTHRWVALATALWGLWCGLELLKSPVVSGRAQRLGLWLIFMFIMQVGLGIATLLTGVNIVLATLHQAGALILIALATAALYELRKNRQV